MYRKEDAKLQSNIRVQNSVNTHRRECLVSLVWGRKDVKKGFMEQMILMLHIEQQSAAGRGVGR